MNHGCANAAGPGILYAISAILLLAMTLAIRTLGPTTNSKNVDAI